MFDRTSCVVVLLLCVSAKGFAQDGTAQDPWRLLQHRTAWVILGVVRLQNFDEWASVPHYESVDRRSSDAWPDVAKPGDTIKFNTPDSLMILDYRKSGEQLFDISPATRAQSMPDDYTGIMLPAGAVVVVDEVSFGPAAGPLVVVWARIRPED